VRQWHIDQISRRVMSALFVIAILAGIGGRLAITARQKTINHDEGMSFMEATGHLQAFTAKAVNEEYPLYAWVKAAELKSYLEIEDAFVFGQIRHDLAGSEVAPPLYYWLAHVWFLLFGTDLSVAVTLNTLLSLATLIAIFALARAVFQDRWMAMAVAGAWFINPTSTYTSFYVRHYQLFTLLAVLFAYVIYRFYYAPDTFKLRPYQAIITALVAGAGVLTHYMFIWVIGAGLAAVTLRFGLVQRRRIAILLGWLALAAVVVLLLHPELRQSLDRQSSRVEPDFTWDSVSERGTAVIDQTIQFVLDRTSFTETRRVIVLAGMIAFPVGLLALAVWRSRRAEDRWQAWRGESKRALFLGMFVVFNYGITVALYTFSFSPHHTMINPWYLSVPWAFCVFIPVWFIDLPTLQPFKKVILPGFMLVMLGAGLLTLYKQYDERVKAADPAKYPDRDTQILIGSVARGVVSPVLINLDDEADVFMASETYLLAHSDEWLPQVQARPTLYFVPTPSVSQFLLSEGFTLESHPTFWQFKVFELHAATAAR
jgi:hypothetical protein